MSWSFRKSKNIGPFRTTISKKEVGPSVGLLGCRVAIAPDGRRYFSFGVPGTGAYYIKYFK